MVDERDRTARYREANGMDLHDTVTEKMIGGLREFTEDLEAGDISKYRKTRFPNFIMMAKELKTYRSNTPKTADDKPIFIGSVVWIGDTYEEITWGSVSEMMSIDDADDSNAVLLSGSCPIAVGFDHFNSDNKFVYSSREALEAAMKGVE